MRYQALYRKDIDFLLEIVRKASQWLPLPICSSLFPFPVTLACSENCGLFCSETLARYEACMAKLTQLFKWLFCFEVC